MQPSRTPNAVKQWPPPPFHLFPRPPPSPPSPPKPPTTPMTPRLNRETSRTGHGREAQAYVFRHLAAPDSARPTDRETRAGRTPQPNYNPSLTHITHASQEVVRPYVKTKQTHKRATTRQREKRAQQNGTRARGAQVLRICRPFHIRGRVYLNRAAPFAAARPAHNLQLRRYTLLTEKRAAYFKK